MMHELDTTNYAGDPESVPGSARAPEPDRPTIWRTLRQRPAQPESVAPAVAAQVTRDRLQALLEQHEPHQPLALAAYLNGTPTLTALDQLTPGEVQAMLDRLLGSPTYTLAAWIKHLQNQAVSAELTGAGWLR
ncbi:hypothetical protein [Deinococcus daejeonensis]|nr:hypothetical protein [Deinococcus daejeonensis]